MKEEVASNIIRFFEKSNGFFLSCVFRDSLRIVPDDYTRFNSKFAHCKSVESGGTNYFLSDVMNHPVPQ